MRQQRGHENREDLAGEHPFGDTGQLILLIVFLVVWVGDSFIFRFSIFLAQYVLLFVRILMGLFFLIAAGYFAEEGMRIVFGEERKEPAVIRKGVFNRVRHPIYLGCVLFYFGMLTFTLSIISGVVCAVVVVFYHFISRYEERLLFSKFGKEYEDYIKSVPMWVPRFRNTQ